MTCGKVSISGVDTAALPVLKNERMRELFPRIRLGDAAAREECITGNLRLVLSVIKRFQNRCDSADDLFQVGCIGLMKAIDNFDTSQNVRFSTYAVPMIIGEIRRYLRDNNPIRVSRSMRDTAYKALRARDQLLYRLGREPSIAEIAAQTECSAEEIAGALEAIQDPISLYDPIFQDGGDTICVMDQVQDTSVSEEGWNTSLCIARALERLGPRERTIISRRFFEGRTQMEVAEEIGISQAQVSRLEKAALGQMRRYVQ
ncbi:MAG: RNA polymerase sporulation sigma factor SigG [Eubacteriales bacterium]|nr:RNA polymerase sporulation sigma factor SigG [Eubacteriales bacterium]